MKRAHVAAAVAVVVAAVLAGVEAKCEDPSTFEVIPWWTQKYLCAVVYQVTTLRLLNLHLQRK
jgi:hypothetical protein